MIALATLFCSGLLALFAAFLKKSQLVLAIVTIGLLASIGCLVYEWNNPIELWNYRGLYFTKDAIVFSVVTLAITLLVSLVAFDRYRNRVEHVGDYYALMIFSACGALCLFSFSNLFMLFLGIEILSIPLYVLAGSNKNNLRSNEAALKYFLMGSFATGILLFGVALIYGGTGSFELNAIRTMMVTAEQMPIMFYIGIFVMLAAMCFKVGAAPFHFWSPDVYTGAPTVITSFMATVVKIAAFGAFFRLFYFFSPVHAHWAPTLAVIAALTMTVANITAVFQDNFKRLLAWSSVSHVGYILMAIIAMNSTSHFNLVFYLTSYALATLLIFTVYMKVKDHTGEEGISAFRGLGKTQPALAAAIILGIVSLAGIPPTAGFFGKYFLFAEVFGQYPWLVVIAILNSTISIYYYFKVVIAMYFTEPETSTGNTTVQVPIINTSVVVICTLGILSLGVLSGFLKVF